MKSIPWLNLRMPIRQECLQIGLGLPFQIYIASRGCPWCRQLCLFSIVMTHFLSWLSVGNRAPSIRESFLKRGHPTLDRIIPLQVVLRERHESQAIDPQVYTHGTPIMKVDGFPICIISRIKCTAICVEFIREHQNHIFGGVIVGRSCVDWFRSVRINQSNMGRKIRDLSWSVDSTEVETSLIRLFLGQKMGDNRIAFYLSADHLSYNDRSYQRWMEKWY